MLRKLLLATLFLLFSKGYLLYAQNQAVLQKEANTYYLHKDYAAALPAYRQLLAKDQLNPEFNFRYGHCLYEIENKDEAAKYFDLLISRSLQADPLLYYFRARIYQHQYFFSKAKSCYEQYQKLTIQDKNALPTTELLNQCKRGVEEVQAFQTLPVLDQKEVKLAKFYQHYSFSEEGYSIYEAPDFLPKYNAKKGFIPIYCYKRGMKYRIVAAHDDSPNQLELFIQKKDANNNWGVIQKISGEVNSAMNEAYAFYDEPSQTLYFSSEANSIGGYDIFQAKFNLQTGQSTDLEKLKYPYASPDDDLFYVIDREQNKIFFTSNRNNAVGSAEIYTLELGKEISAPFIFAGNFKNIANPNQAVASISFVSLTSQIEYGPFVSQADGAYLIALPPKENYTLVVRQEGAATAYRTHFTIPNLTSEQLLNQQITYQLNEFGKEQYVVINRILPKDAEKQVDLLAQAQVQLKAQTLKAMQPAKYTASAASSRSPLFSQFTWAQTDTLEFVTQITDSLLAAEVSLENQVRLSEVLRNAFELKLAQREKLLSKGPSKELDQLNKELALIKEWLEVNQAANIPNMELLAKIQAVNEKAAAYLHNQQQIELLKSWEAAQLELAQFLQIAAYDGQQALQLAQQDLQLTLQATSQQLLALKSDKSEYQKQLQQLEKNLSLQSKKEQALTQARIDELKSQIAKINSELTVLEQHRDLQVKQLAIFDQPELIEEFISRSENQSLPELEISETLTEMLAQYEQQQILVSEVQGFIQSSNQGSNEISNGSTNETRSSNQASNEKSSTNQSSNQTSNEGSNEENLTRANEGSNGIPNGSTNEARSSNQSSNKGSNEENRARANGGSSEVSNGSTNETRSSNQASNETSSTNQSSNQTSNKGSNEENLARANEESNEVSNGSTNETRSSNQSSNETRSTNQTSNKGSNEENLARANEGSNEVSNGSTNETRSSNQASNETSSTNQSSNQTSNKGSNEENLTRANEVSNEISNGSTNEARSSNQSSNETRSTNQTSNEESNEVSNGSTNETRSSNQASNETSSTNQSSNQTSNKGSNEENLARANEESNEENRARANGGSSEVSNGSTNETRSSNQASNETSSTNQSSNQTSNKGSNEENLARANEGSNGISNGSTDETRSSNQTSNKGSNEENQTSNEGSNEENLTRANEVSNEISNGSTDETRTSNQSSNETRSTNQSSNQTSNKGSNEENLARANEVSNEISNGSTNETRSSNQSSNKGSNEVRSTNQTKEIEAELKSFEEVAQQILENNTDQIIAIEAFPSLVKTRTELETLEASLALPVAKLESAPELKAEQWETYLAYLKARDSLESAKQRYLDWNTKMQALELAYLENPSPETLQEMKEVAQNLQEVAALKVLQQELLKVKDQAQFEALFNLGYLPPYELKNIQAEANNGTVFSFNATPVYEQIQIGLPCPKGLVFRVQVGAFRKPIPAGRFTEFKPVDGRILANGLTVVMAGYFKNSAEAVEQRDLIRKLGYADAFVVAYNGCERMNMSDAQRLEVVASGGTQSVKKSIFAGPGMQLFYTVQVGVYNRPLISEKQLGLPELIEAQTAKGQYRYASGRFDNLVAAKERQKLAVKKGITDAFIIAYYQGKRISLAEAKQLQLQGIAMQTTIEKTPESKPAVMTLSTMPKLPIKNQLVPTEQEVRFEQKCFTCQDRLADLNHYGVFTYLPEKAMISSAQFKESELNTLQRYYLKSFKKVDQNWTGPVQTLQLDPSAVSGAQMDWLLRQNQPYRILKATQDTYQIEIQLPK